MKVQKRAGVVIAVLALSMVGGSPAMAANFTAGSYPASVTGSQPEGAGKHKIQMGSGTVECESATFAGTVSGAGPTLTVDPKMSGCKAFGLNGSVTLNGCDLVLHAGFNTSFSYSCPPGQYVTIHTAGNLCNAHIGSQSQLAGVSYANNGNHVDITFNVQTLHSVVTGTIFCPVTASTTTYTNGKYTGTITLKGDNGATKIDVG